MMIGKATTEQVIKQTTTKLASDISNLSDKRNETLSIFRQTAVQLNDINSELRAKVDTLNELDSFIQNQRNSANQMINDNDAVRSKILEIIGE